MCYFCSHDLDALLLYMKTVIVIISAHTLSVAQPVVMLRAGVHQQFGIMKVVLD